MRGFVDKVLTEPLSDFLQRLIEFLPNLLSSLVIMTLGFFTGWVLKNITLKILEIINADRFCHRTGITHALEKGGIKDKPTVLIGKVFYWLVVIIFAIMALYTLRVPAVANLLERFFLYLPNVFVAVVLIIVGYVLSNFLARATLIASVNAGIRISGFLSKGVKAGVIVLSLTMALEQLGIGHDTVIIAFSLLFGGVVFALALAFGLAGKDLAKEYLEKRFGREQEEKDDLKHL
ncbi:hypothetical protein BMS3Bbin06_02126 [bacterium BMS3Bbin06]|nr:hypothetical protein BMS3Bbin06_02126 [bacterium BMS3Bbin06]HDO36287.1 hypothetical protein [Nitrospirota bacterium]